MNVFRNDVGFGIDECGYDGRSLIKGGNVRNGDMVWVSKPFIDFPVEDGRAYLDYFGMIKDENVYKFDYYLYVAYMSGAKEVEIGIYSLGGDPFAGSAFYDILRSWGKRMGIRTRILGCVASAAVMPYMAGHVRVSSKYGMLMIHDMKMFVGQYPYKATTEAEHDARVARKLQERFMDIVYDNLREKKLTREQLSDMCRQDFWMTAEEAKEYGFVDEIIDV